MGQPHDAQVLDLGRARPADPARTARRRLAAARRASGLTSTEFAARLDQVTQYRVTARAVTTWETDAIPPADVLIAAEQIAGPGTVVEPVRLITDAVDLQQTMAAVVAGARQLLAVTGSRSRDPGYLAGIEQVLAERAELVHWRVLYGPLRHGALRNHLLRLVDMQRAAGTLHVGMCRDLLRDHERFLVASESEALVILPSLHGIMQFDTALHLTEPALAAAWVDHVRQAHLGAEPVTDRAVIEAMEIV